MTFNIVAADGERTKHTISFPVIVARLRKGSIEPRIVSYPSPNRIRIGSNRIVAAVLRSALLILRSVLFTFPDWRASFPGIYLRCLTACSLSQKRPSRLIGGT